MRDCWSHCVLVPPLSPSNAYHVCVAAEAAEGGTRHHKQPDVSAVCVGVFGVGLCVWYCVLIVLDTIHVSHRCCHHPLHDFIMDGPMYQMDGASPRVSARVCTTTFDSSQEH